MATPRLTKPKVDARRVTAVMATTGRNLLLKRAFPGGRTAARSVRGHAARPLTERYKRRKLARGRLGIPNQRFTSRTAQALGQVRRVSPREVVVGFRTRREIALALQERNQFMGHGRKERAQILDSAARVLQRSVRKTIRVVGGRIVLKV